MAYRSTKSYRGKTPEARQRQLQNLRPRNSGKRIKAKSEPSSDPFELAYKNDIITFVENHFFLPETRRPIVLLDWQKDIFRDLFCKPKGQNPSMALIGCPKKSGKSTQSACVGLWFLITRNLAEIYIMGPDIQQSQLVVFDKISKAIRLHPALRKECKITGERIECKRNDSFIQVLPCNYTSAGLNPDLILFDELWQFISEASRRAWDEMTNVPNKENLILVTTYAGYSEDEDSILWRLYKQAMDQAEGKAERDDRFYFLWRTDYKGVPWVNEQYLTRQQRRLRPSSFARLHRNEWVSGEEAFVTASVINNCTDHNHRRGAPISKPVCIGLDIGLKHDCSAICVVSTVDKENIIVVDHAVFIPKEGQTLDLERTVEQQILTYAKQYKIDSVYYDPFQAARSAKTLSQKGVPMVEYCQTLNNTVAMSECLQGFLQSGKITLYDDDELRQHLLNAHAKESQRGWRLVKSRAEKKIDLAVSLALAAKAAQDSLLNQSNEIFLASEDETWDPWVGRKIHPRKAAPKNKETGCLSLSDIEFYQRDV